MDEHQPEVVLFWHRRDLRLMDNHGLHAALQRGLPVVPIFIFDSQILDELEDPLDRRVEFIHNALEELQALLVARGSTLDVRIGKPEMVWQQLAEEYRISAVYANRDDEPYAVKRDRAVTLLLAAKQIDFHLCKDQTIFNAQEVVKDDGKPYTVFTPFRNRWRNRLESHHYAQLPSESTGHFLEQNAKPIPSLAEIGFRPGQMPFPERKIRPEIIEKYHLQRNLPAVEGTSRLGVHLRFGTVSIRSCVEAAIQMNETWLDELIWREFFMQILAWFPRVVEQPFKEQYAAIPWINDENQFDAWCQGQTGYPIVDAGMRELNQTGFMHNRVRMIAASFLAKHLLIDWLWGERYFAAKLLDYDLAANNGNWQWAAGCGCDAAPYFRVFNPLLQAQKFDPQGSYIKKWIPELDTPDYPPPIVEHRIGRQRAIDTYRAALASVAR
ncbi:MAG TPA: deoxyribodipyrimidine photo-lyase [bacterium]|nr:deoxyribodipyrimidine photo-lyase [bacterium]HPG44364.1 deoxyribodipyrimidine photo-lyase [bacterium]HPM96922.1 deoxyribodipyrimidine photo-lyase [bacterium]